jgi:6-pyruvoyltetrahydropterin/6-carboxytetrahydropterin synthase
MYEVTAALVISASHHLRGYQGKCENVHGHNYRIEATVAAGELDGTGLAVDFKVLKEHLHKVAGKFDHTDLNRHGEFQRVNPSSENLARVVFSGLKESMRGLPVKVVRVSVWESEGSYVTYLE